MLDFSGSNPPYLFRYILDNRQWGTRNPYRSSDHDTIDLDRVLRFDD